MFNPSTVNTSLFMRHFLIYFVGIRLDSRQLDALDEVFRHVKCNIINASKCALEDDVGLVVFS